MKYCLPLLFLILYFQTATAQQYKDGTIIMYSGGRPIVTRFIERRLVHNKWSHVGIVLDDHLWEATPPSVMKTDMKSHAMKMRGCRRKAIRATRGRRGLEIQVWEPKVEYNEQQKAAMKQVARANLGRRYSVRSWFNKRRQMRGITCAAFASTVLEATGAYEFGFNQTVAPHEVFYGVMGNYQRIECDYTRTVNP